MMDHKSWLWKKKTTEKTLVAADKLILSQKGNEEEIQTLQTDKAALEREMKILDTKLSSALSVCNAKDDLVEKHAKMAQEALAGWEKAEAEAILLKQELDEVLRQRLAGEERQTHLDMALKECMQQLRFVREEQEKRIHDAVMKTSREFEKSRIVLEEKLAETNKRLAKLGAENVQLGKALLAKEKLIGDVNEQRTRAEADFNALKTRLESTEKDNSSLKYEVRVLEKELEIRNEEREFNCRTADVAHKQHLESVKKIAKLESECQRLRLLVRKRLPGPAAIAKMKNEVEILGRDQVELRRRKSNPSPTGSVDSAIDNAPDTPSKKINYLSDQLCALEEENRSLKETLNKKTNELQFFRIMHAPNASKLSQIEEQLKELSIGQIAMESEGYMPKPQELSVATSDMNNDDGVCCPKSWAAALISELEHFRNGKHMVLPSQKSVGTSDIDLMDDFVEMEKLAVVSMDKQFGSSHLASVEGNEIVGPLQIQSSGDFLAATDRKIVNGIFPSWLQDILKVVLEQNQITQRKPDEILEDIKVALQYINNTNSSERVDSRESSNQYNASNHSDVSGYMYWKHTDKSPMMDSAGRPICGEISSGKKSNHQVQSKLSKSICKTIELIEGMGLQSLDYGASEINPANDESYFSYKNSETPSGYMVRVFQWKTSELGVVLQQFIQTCNDLLTGKAGLEKFAEELTSALDWIMNHCFSLQDVSSMRDAIKKHFDWDESRSESEVEIGMINQFSEADKFCSPKEHLPYLPIVTAWNDHKKEETQLDVIEESKKLKDVLANAESANKDLEERLHSEIDKNESLMIQLQESHNTIKSFQAELETLKESKGMIENQIENQKLVNEDLDRQLTVARVELNEIRQGFSSLETEMENKSNCCEELEATCIDLQLQLQSVTKKAIPEYDVDQEEKQLQTDGEIKSASEKLAECQETILNLGRQFRTMASPREAALFDKLVSNPLDNLTVTTTTPRKSVKQRSSLLDKMLAEDNSAAGDLISDPQKWYLRVNGIKHNDDEAVDRSLAVVPSKKKGSEGLLKKLLCSRNKSNSKKVTLLCAA